MLNVIKRTLLGRSNVQTPTVAVNLRAAHLFAGMSNAQFAELEPLLKPVSLEAGALLIKENTPAEALWILKQGTLEVFKVAEGGRHHVLATLKPGECLGQLALFDEQTRSASVRAATDVTLQRLDKSDLETLRGPTPSAYDIVLKNVGHSLSECLKQTNDKTVSALESALQASEQRIALALTLAYGMFLLSLFTVLNEMIASMVTQAWVSPLINVPILIFSASSLYFMMKQTRLPLSLFGLRFEQIKSTVFESLLWSAGFIIALTLVKAFFIYVIPVLPSASVFQFPVFRAAEQQVLPLFWAGVLLYVVSVPLQEFIVRGALQAPLMHFLPASKWRNTIAIVISTTLFTALHTHLGPIFALVVFVPGVFWGMLYAKQQSLLGVTVSHWLIGLWTFHFLGMNVSAQSLRVLFQ